jgi:alpha-glucosidase (family GH31 glycosyl hydrolase)
MHHGGVNELDAHSLFGTMEVKTSHEYFQNKQNRTMIIERSSYAGMGKFGSRWLGDNFAQPEYMGYSVTGIMGMNIAGIPLVGSDICGFIFNTTEELCARWYTLGAFYPFARNHNSWDTIPQEPWVWTGRYDNTIEYSKIIENAMKTRMSLIKYYHTELTYLHLNGGTFFKPLFFEFPDDAAAMEASQEYNFMLGSAIKLGILTNMGTNSSAGW